MQSFEIFWVLVGTAAKTMKINIMKPKVPVFGDHSKFLS